MAKKLLLMLILAILILIPSIASHPHPIYSITADEYQIKVHALHPQSITEQYIRDNLLLNDCELGSIRQDEGYLKLMETVVYIEHSCSKPTIAKNTLFNDYWGNVPLTVHMTGIEGGNDREGFGFFRLTGNIFLDIMLIFIFGVISSFIGDLFRFIIPLSIAEKAGNDRFFIFRAIGLHLVVTYIVIIFGLNFISSWLNRYLWIIFIITGALIFLENYFRRKNLSPYIIAAVPCPATTFIAALFLQERMILALLTPIIIIGAELIILLLIRRFVTIKKDYRRYMPAFFMIIGIGLFIFSLFSLNMISAIGDDDSCRFNEKVLNEYFIGLEFQLQTSESCDEIIDYINSHTCSNDAAIDIGEDRFYFTGGWSGSRAFNYSYEKEHLAHLDCWE